MGLFGGFRAKFTKNSKSKESPNQTSVVSLKFKLNSEFDIGNAYPNGIQSVTKNTVSRPRAPIRSATFEDNNRTLLEKLKSRSLINISNPPSSANSSKEYQYNEPHIQKSNSVKEARYSGDEGGKKHFVHTGNGKVEVPVKKTSSVRIKPKSEEIENNYVYTGPGGSIHQYDQVIEKFSINKEDSSSTLIMMTQHEPDKSNMKNNKKPEPSEIEQNPQEEFKVNVKATENDEFYDNNDLLEFKPILQQKSDEDYNNSNKKFKTKKEELEEFKVNVVHHDQDYVSEDELSYTEEEVQSDFNGYSSQATTIFFGASDAPPPPIRPRRLNFLKEEDDDDNEMEC